MKFEDCFVEYGEVFVFFVYVYLLESYGVDVVFGFELDR